MRDGLIERISFLVYKLEHYFLTIDTRQRTEQELVKLISALNIYDKTI